MTETSPMIAVLAVLIACAAVTAMAVVLWRSRKAAPAEDAAMAELTRAQADAAARL
jgi:hypothetical protein